MGKHLHRRASPGVQPLHHFRRMSRWVSALAVCFVLGACGGGGASSGSNQEAGSEVIQGILTSGLVVPSESEAATASVATTTDGSGLVLSNLSGTMQSVKDGQVVMLPANDAQGLPFGYTGKAVLQGDGTVKLEQANISDVFKTLAVDFDSARDGGQVVGLITPTGGKMSFSQNPSFPRQVGLDWALCQVGLEAVVNVKCSDGALQGTISLEQPIKVKSKDGKSEAVAKLYATIALDKLSARTKIDFDAEKYLSTGGFNLLETGVAGTWSASMGIKLDDDTFSASIPSWSELFRADSKNIWDANTRIKFEKYFELSGLGGADKNGLIPLGGIYFTPASALAGGRPFRGDLSAAQLGQIKKMAAVVLIYIDLSGKLVMSGDLKFFESVGGIFNRGFKIQRVDGSLSGNLIDEKKDPDLFSPWVTGKIESTQNIGLAAGVDFLVAGIRPASLKTTLIGVNATAIAEGDGGYRWAPEPKGVDGKLCLRSSTKIFSSVEANAAIKAKINGGWLSVSGGAESRLGPIQKTWHEEPSLDTCPSKLKIPDTGITANQCYAAGSDVLVSCISSEAIALNSKQDGMITPGSAGMSYSLVGSYSKEECVKDNITGLIWEGKPTSGTRAATQIYTNYGDGRSGDASAYVTTVNQMALCGYSDWRLPTFDELLGLVDNSVFYPDSTINTTWFSNTQQYEYWTATEYAGNSGGAWYIYFGHGLVYGVYGREGSYHVRLVR